MTPARKRRLYWILGILRGRRHRERAGALRLRKNVMFFFDPSRKVRGGAPGGRVNASASARWPVQGSFHRQPGSLDVNFVVTDFKTELPVKATPACCPICSGKGRASSLTAASAQTACSSRTKCSPSTTRSTCRRRWRSR